MSDFKLIQKATALASTDADYKAELLSNTKEALRKVGFTAPEGVTVHFVEEGTNVPPATSSDIYLQLGKVDNTATMELDEEALQAVAAGGTCQSTASTAGTIPSCVSSASSASSKCQ